MRSHCKCEVHAVLAKCGVQVIMSDLFGLEGEQDVLKIRLAGGHFRLGRLLFDVVPMGER